MAEEITRLRDFSDIAVVDKFFKPDHLGPTKGECPGNPRFYRVLGVERSQANRGLDLVVIYQGCETEYRVARRRATSDRELTDAEFTEFVGKDSGHYCGQ